MPKLNSATASQVEEAEGIDFEAIPEDIYPAVLDGEVEPKEGPKGLYWKWTFKLTGDNYAGRKMFVNTSLNESAFWKLKEVFEAFGVSADTDTDDLIGRPVKLMVVQRLIENGSRKGDMGNEVRQVLPVQSVTVDPDAPKPSKSSAKNSKPADSVPLF